MNRQKVVVHVLVKNEEVWIWYALMSVLDEVDEIMVWDTGSTDNTVKIIKSIDSPKIKFRQSSETNNETDHSQIRTLMISESAKYDWMLVLDGDEIWLPSSLKLMIDFINSHSQHYDCLVGPTLNCVGDVFHISPHSRGRYHLAGRTGHYSIRFINLKIPGLHISNPVGGLQSYVDQNEVALQNRDSQRIHYLDAPYIHTTHLVRSLSKKNNQNVFSRAGKRKFDLGISLPTDFEFPNSFYFPRPILVQSAFQKRSLAFLLQAFWQTPLRKLKNKISHA